MLLASRTLALALLASLAWSGCVPPADGRLDEHKNPYFIAGQERVKARDYKGAIEAFERALEVNPQSALAHFELGVLYEQRENDYPAAIYHYNKVLKLRPKGEYPAEHARLRIPACKQEMVKTDMLSTVNPAALRELERLREENQQLRRYVEYLQGLLQSRVMTPPQPAPGRGPASAPPASDTASRPPASRPPAVPSPAPAPARRTHVIQANETFSSVARRYGVPLNALLAANPGLNPRRLPVGQIIRIPSP